MQNFSTSAWTLAGSRAAWRRLARSRASVDGPGGVGLADLAVFAERVAAEGQDRVQAVPPGTEDVRLADVSGRVHRPLDEDDDVVADLMLVLELDESVVEPLPLGHVGRRVRDAAVPQQMVDLRAGQPLVVSARTLLIASSC